MVSKKEILEDLVFCELARCIECSTLLMGDIMQNYFDFFTTNDKEGREMLAYEMKRYRAYANAVYDMLRTAEQELHKNGIYCYTD